MLITYPRHLFAQHALFFLNLIMLLLQLLILFSSCLKLCKSWITFSESVWIYFYISPRTSISYFLSILLNFLESWQYFFSGRLKTCIPFYFFPKSLSNILNRKSVSMNYYITLLWDQYKTLTYWQTIYHFQSHSFHKHYLAVILFES